jgi:cell division protein ZapA
LKQRYNIRIMGQELSVLSDKGDEYVEKVVQYVNDRAKEIGDASENVTTLSIAMLVALNIADELFKIKEEKEDLFSTFEGRAEELINYIDEKRQNIGNPLQCP